ncbi:MAG TPA: hypothetical protein VK994_00220 [Bacteroidales bacterium]|nr:hypothetical protein [Bacteroidales bacterium]
MSQGKAELVRSSNTFTDIKYYLFNKPPVKTLVEHRDSQVRKNFVDSILQRTGIDVNNYKMLNIHQVGVEAPASYVFDELMQWSGDAICWPNHIAKVELQDENLEHIKIYLFGINKRVLGLNLFHLFDLSAIKIQRVPAPLDPDNARYLLYECNGGYPIGVFSMFVRSSIPEREEHSMSQLFIMVSFNFYGKNTRINIFNKVWERVHNRVTSNVVFRIKQLCENKFESFTHEQS